MVGPPCCQGAGGCAQAAYGRASAGSLAANAGGVVCCAPSADEAEPERGPLLVVAQDRRGVVQRQVATTGEPRAAPPHHQETFLEVPGLNQYFCPLHRL